MQNLLKELTELLSKDERLVAEDGKLLKGQVVEFGLKLDPELIKLLYSHEIFNKHFFLELDGLVVFDKERFLQFISNKDFLPDSYTSYKNKIGLSDDGGTTYISRKQEVELVWPYKDCILEGGQTKEESSRDEVFWNTSLAPIDISRIFSPKAFTNFTRIDDQGENELDDFINEPNLVIKGNNLQVISSLASIFHGKIKLICLDPPYNKGNDDFNYNDSFTHSTWLSFMKTRMELSRKLLHPNGTLFIFCDVNEHAYLKVLLDEIFGRNRFITTVVWRNSDNSNNDAKQFSLDHNYILVYSNNELWESYKLDRTEDQAKHYKNPDNDPRGPWFDGNPVNSPNPRKNLMYQIEAPNGNHIDPPPNGWRWDRTTLHKKMESGEIRFSEDFKTIIRRTYLNEQKGLPPSSLWTITEDNLWVNLEETGHTRQAKYEQKKLFPEIPTSELFRTPKPERVIQKILRISTEPGDYVLDFFSGSGTTGAVAHKMGRKYIVCEQMEYIHTFTIPRLKMVIGGEQGGISEDEGWKGGGNFCYLELIKLNERFVKQIQQVKTTDEVLALWEQIKDNAFLSFKVDVKKIDESVDEFTQLSLKNQRRFLMEVLEHNSMYISYSEIDDKEYSIDIETKKMNSKLYDIKPK